MTVEPNQSMEDQLRTHAESRRLEAPPFELDGATRHRLQEEVRQVYRAESTPSHVARSGWFWARLGLVGAATAAALLLSVQLLEQQPPFFPGQPAATDLELAALEESAGSSEPFDRGMNGAALAPMMAERSSSTNSLSVAPVPASAEVASAEGTLPARPEVAAVPQVSRAATAPGPAVRPGAEEQLFATESESLRQASTLTAAMTESRKISETTDAMVEVEDSVLGGAVQSGQRFQQIQQYRRNPNSPAAPRVLQSFQWIREGDEVRVIDEDGSVYTGTLGASATGAASDRYALSASMKPEAAGVDQPTQVGRMTMAGVEIGERFMVLGTNRTLNVPVKFEGVWLPRAGQAPTITNNAWRAEPSAVSQAAAQIQGRALVGGGTRLGIVADARPE